MLNRIVILIIFAISFLSPNVAHADSGWNEMGFVLLAGVFPFLLLIVGIFIYLVISKVSRLQNI